MKQLTEMSLQELNELKTDVEDEIASREAKGNGFDKEYYISGKAYKGVTRHQWDYALKLEKETNSSIEVSLSQAVKRMESSDMSEAIQLMRDGKRIRIYN